MKSFINFFLFLLGISPCLLFAEDLTIPRPSGYLGFGPDKFVIMDRNLGATSNDITSPDSYGLYFQRGNNHGLKVTAPTTKKKAIWDEKYRHKGYYGGDAFIRHIPQKIDDCGDYWEDVIDYNGAGEYINGSYNDLRGGENDSHTNHLGMDTIMDTQLNRQGPCPTGYHVPSAGEWAKLLEYWCLNHGTSCNHRTKIRNTNGFESLYNENFDDINNNPALLFSTELKIPSARLRGYDGEYSNFSYTWLWSSSKGKGASCDSPVFAIRNVYIDSYLQGGHVDALPIRCFKNYDNPMYSPISSFILTSNKILFIIMLFQFSQYFTL